MHSDDFFVWSRLHRFHPVSHTLPGSYPHPLSHPDPGADRDRPPDRFSKALTLGNIVNERLANSIAYPSSNPDLASPKGACSRIPLLRTRRGAFSAVSSAVRIHPHPASHSSPDGSPDSTLAGCLPGFMVWGCR
jgi:hypothetical protein